MALARPAAPARPAVEPAGQLNRRAEPSTSDTSAHWNAFDLVMLRELSEAYARLEAEPDLRVMLLYSTGPNFTAGLDLAEVGPAVESGLSRQRFVLGPSSKTTE